MLSYLEFKVVYLFSELFFHFFSCRMYLPTSLKESLKMDSWKKSFVFVGLSGKTGMAIHPHICKKKKKKSPYFNNSEFHNLFWICESEDLQRWLHQCLKPCRGMLRQSTFKQDTCTCLISICGYAWTHMYPHTSSGKRSPPPHTQFELVGCPPEQVCGAVTSPFSAHKPIACSEFIIKITTAAKRQS